MGVALGRGSHNSNSLVCVGAAPVCLGLSPAPPQGILYPSEQNKHLALFSEPPAALAGSGGSWGWSPILRVPLLSVATLPATPLQRSHSLCPPRSWHIRKEGLSNGSFLPGKIIISRFFLVWPLNPSCFPKNLGTVAPRCPKGASRPQPLFPYRQSRQFRSQEVASSQGCRAGR